jgi:hypothetical protein
VGALEFLIEDVQSRDTLSAGNHQMFVRSPGRTLDLMIDAITLIDKGLFRAVQEQNSHTPIEDQLKGVAALCYWSTDSATTSLRTRNSAAVDAREILAFPDPAKGVDPNKQGSALVQHCEKGTQLTHGHANFL